MFEHWKVLLGKGLNLEAIYMGLSQAFHTIEYQLLIAKLSTYGFSKNSINLMNCFLNE